MLFTKASPPIEHSVLEIHPDTYQMGSKFICKRATADIPEDAVGAWGKDHEQYYLVKILDSYLSSSSSAAEGLVYQAGTSSAVWAIGKHAICKVKTWAVGMEEESRTLAFVAARFPHIPIPEVIYSWIDDKMERTFLILRRVEGQTLQKAWPSLSLEGRNRVAASVAQYCSDLADATSGNLESSTGLGVLEPFLNVDGEESHPTWKPRPLGPFSHSMAKRYFQRISTQQLPIIGDEFHFYHSDLGPTNILVSGDGTVVSILDWESAGFYPRFWIALKPYRSRGFNLDSPDDARYEWVDLLLSKLADLGFVLDHEHVKWHKTLNYTYFDVGELGHIE
ncbi:hypothetical protein BJX64DRAFT_291005 [Aspergillus heterothallicus]